MKHIDLFSGIGGFALAAQWAWGEEYENICFCDNNRFCQEILKQRFKGARVYGDIRKLNRKQLIADTDKFRHIHRKSEKQSAETGKQAFSQPVTGNPVNGLGRGTETQFTVDLLTGGFPCQPFSQAGKRRGTEDDRYLWPEMLRVIRETKPKWVVAENVSGLVSMSNGMVLEQVLFDLEAEAYEVQPFIIPACAQNAPHRRDRIWIVGHSKHDGQYATQNGQSNRKRNNNNEKRQDKICQFERTNSLRGNAPDTRCQCGQQGYSERMEKGKTKRATGTKDFERCNQDAPDTRRQRQTQQKQQTTRSEQYNRNAPDTESRHTGKPSEWKGRENLSGGNSEKWNWNQDWSEVATELCGMDDGLPTELDGFKLSKAGHRTERLKALGNAIVPQVAYQIFQSIILAEQERSLVDTSVNNCDSGWGRCKGGI